MKDAGIQSKKLPVRSPNLNARVERFVRMIKTECLDHFIAFGQDHLELSVFASSPTTTTKSRPHSNRNHRPPANQNPPPEMGNHPN